jgi:hypothetical protein
MKYIVLIACMTLSAYSQFTASEAKAIAAYPQTVEKMNHTYQASLELARLSASDSEFNRQFHSGNHETLEGQIHVFESLPKAAGIIRSHDLSVRDYCLTTMAINLAMLPEGRIPEAARSKGWQSDPVYEGISTEHIRFVDAHLAEIRKIKSELLAIYKASKGK